MAISICSLEQAARTPVPFYEKMGMHVVKIRKIDCGPCIVMTSTILEKKTDAVPSSPADG